MAETLGSLCDKLTIVKLKQFHSDDSERLTSLSIQENNLKIEIDAFISNALNGNIPIDKLTFKANKVYKKEGNEIRNLQGTIGEVFASLADVNCLLWHEQEKVYEFDTVPPDEKDKVVKKLAVLNLERNKCMDEIDSNFQAMVRSVLENE